MSLSPTVLIALLGWPVITLVLFAVCTPRRAATIALVGGWLLLPDAVGFKIPGFTDLTKASVIALAIVASAVLFDVGSLLRLRPRFVDLFALVWCVCPMASSIDNGLGAYDGLQAVRIQVETWGLPFLIGRIYYSDIEGMTELAHGLVLGGLVYVPLCIFESRMSPQLNQMVYGFYAYDWAGGASRLGGWRPSVFMQFGLVLGLWMACISLVAIWLWVNGTRTLMGLPMGLVMSILVITTVMCRSLGSLVLMAAAVGVMLLARWFRLGALVFVMLLIPVAYPVARYTGVFSGDGIVSFSQGFSSDRAASLKFRLDNEDMLIDKASQRPLVGWGRWGRARVTNDEGKDISTTDGIWIIYLGSCGWVGLTSLTVMMLLPGALVMRKLKPYRLWAEPALAPVAVMVMIPIIYMIDCLPNGFVNPVYICVAGGLAGWVMPVFAYAAAPAPTAPVAPVERYVPPTGPETPPRPAA
ncbi:MAG: O-antigen ligase domain-containing protein [Planctomycetota bacterium]|nr:O-antigen ligase domain-containing protein [Planctomycetota bacterium]